MNKHVCVWVWYPAQTLTHMWVCVGVVPCTNTHTHTLREALGNKNKNNNNKIIIIKNENGDRPNQGGPRGRRS